MKGPVFANPLEIPECWVESLISQNEIYDQQREFYKNEAEQIFVVFQDKDLFIFDEPSNALSCPKVHKFGLKLAPMANQKTL